MKIGEIARNIVRPKGERGYKHRVKEGRLNCPDNYFKHKTNENICEMDCHDCVRLDSSEWRMK